ncbi:MAG: hypothetical protein WAU65_02815 [Candidatus Nanoarchaeia archaeon]
MKKSSLIAASLFAVGKLLYGQNLAIPEPTPIYQTADGILATNYVNQLPRDKDTDINSLISGGNVTSLTFLDPISVLKGKLNYLKNDPRAKDFYSSKGDSKTSTTSDEARLRLIKTYEGLLAKVSSEKRTPEYYRSLENLSKSLSVSNHIITTKELEGILGDFTYAIDKQGKKSNGEIYDVPMLVTFPVAGSKPTIESITPPKKKNFTEPKQTESLSLPKIKEPKKTSTLKYAEKGPALIIGGNIDAPLEYDFQIGAKWDNLALIGYLGTRPDTTLINSQSNLSGNIYFMENEQLTDFVSFGGSVVGYIPVTDHFSLSLGASLGETSYTRKDLAAIADLTNPNNPSYINSTNSSYTQKEWSAGVEVGPNLIIGSGPNGLGINPYVEYRRIWEGNLSNILNDSNQMIGAGVRLIWYIDKPKSGK